MKYVLLFFLFYVLFKFVTRILIPVLRAGRTVKAQMREMQSRMEEMQQQASTPQPSKPKVVDGDSIDYEEIK